MASDYTSIRKENEMRYGTDIGRIGPMLLTDRYDDRTHFIFELLQNAEDAYANHGEWNGSRSVKFELSETELKIFHFGKPFDEVDVRAICGIGEGKKDGGKIGKFGIGFKSVYAFTDRPEIYSGDESFAVENFVWPTAVAPLNGSPDKTQFVLPFQKDDLAAFPEISKGLQKIGARALMFLREIEEVEWMVNGVASGVYLRSKPEILSEGVRRINVIGQETNKEVTEESWLIFSDPVTDSKGAFVGNVEIAYLLVQDEKSKTEKIRRIHQSKLVVFFSTIVETHVGFLIQGPYNTTPSRDNIHRQDLWNQYCVEKTSELIKRSLVWLRDQKLLSVDVLQCLPINRLSYKDQSIFEPLFETTKDLLISESLLPNYGGNYTSASNAKLAKSQDLRELFSPIQLEEIYGSKNITWISDQVSEKTPELRDYLMKELDIDEIRPEAIIARMNIDFLQKQSDDWIRQFYEFLNKQPSLHRRVLDIPIIRLSNGKHVNVQDQYKKKNAFLPTSFATNLPIIKTSVCNSEEALAFLRSIGITEPDLVDDVIENTLTKYDQRNIDISGLNYESDIERILAAYKVDSSNQRNKLLSELKRKFFVMAIDPGNGEKQLVMPGDVYLATDRLKELFRDISGVLLVDDGQDCLRGEDIRNLLEDCGAVRYLRPIPDRSLTYEELKKLRIDSGSPITSGQNDRIEDWTLYGLLQLITILPNLSTEQQKEKSRLLWEELIQLEDRRGKSVFEGKYSWTYYGQHKSPPFDTAFIRLLKKNKWIPDKDGDLQTPELILFESLDWKSAPFLESKIKFKPPVLNQLAVEAGIEIGALELLKQLGLTSKEELLSKLGLSNISPTNIGVSSIEGKDAREASGDFTVDDEGEIHQKDRSESGTEVSNSHAEKEYTSEIGTTRKPVHDNERSSERTDEDSNRNRTEQEFVSYIRVHPEEKTTSVDTEYEAHLEVEESALEFILRVEPEWIRAANNNPGYDLFQIDENEKVIRWCELKAMTGSLKDHPVGLSHKQFMFAAEKGENFWFYIVEHANTESPRILRIQDPVGKARTFSFDKGWADIAIKDL